MLVQASRAGRTCSGFANRDERKRTRWSQPTQAGCGDVDRKKENQSRRRFVFPSPLLGSRLEEARNGGTEVKLSGTIATTVPATADPERGEWRCPKGHDSSIPPNYPALMFAACGHYRSTVVATWNEFCITCGVRHVPFAIYWRAYSSHSGPTRVHNPKNYCGYCGAKMVCG
jgi:hypothetical protein